MNAKERALWRLHKVTLQMIRKWGYENIDFSGTFLANLPRLYEDWAGWTDDERRHQRADFAGMVNEQLRDDNPVHWGGGSPQENAEKLLVQIIALDLLTPLH